MNISGKVTTKLVVELEVEGESVADIQWGIQELKRRLCVGRVMMDASMRSNRRMLITGSEVKPR